MANNAVQVQVQVEKNHVPNWLRQTYGIFNAITHIGSGRLIPLLTRHVSKHDMMNIYYGHRTEQLLRVKIFIDFMVERIASNRSFFLKQLELRGAYLRRDRGAKGRG